MIRNILLDWSGTLVDDLGVVLRATNHVFRELGRTVISEEEFRREFALPHMDFYHRYLPGVPDQRIEELFHSCFREIQDDVRLLNHARGFLEFCRTQKIRLFILSTIFRDHFEKQSARNSIRNFFEGVYLEVVDKRNTIHEVLRENSLNPSETLFVGDMIHDIEAGKAGGVMTCAVLTGFNRAEQLKSVSPDLLMEHLGELQIHLQNSFQSSSASNEKRRIPISTVGGLIFNAAGEILMIQTHKWSNKWGIPGGKIKYGETSQNALKREIMEETNLEVDHIEFVLVQDCIESAEFFRPEHFLLLNYTCTVKGPCDVRLNDEAQRWVWVSIEDSLKMDLNTPTRILIEAVQKEQKP